MGSLGRLLVSPGEDKLVLGIILILFSLRHGILLLRSDTPHGQLLHLFPSEKLIYKDSIPLVGCASEVRRDDASQDFAIGGIIPWD
jgi:hypothetical protein